MENKINVAELLKNCPKGMELDCMLWDNVTFERVAHNGIGIWINYLNDKNYKYEIYLDNEGCLPVSFLNLTTSKCVIFPKGKTTWEGFQRPFVEGDIVFYNNTIAIFKEWGDETLFRSYVIKYLDKDCDTIMRDVPLFGKGVRKEIRFATEEEKAKLFKSIKNNGYRWNPETKTLEKLLEFKDGDILANDDDNTVFIYNGMEELSPSPRYYVYVIAEKNDLFFAINISTKKYGTRFATEEEKAELFKAIKDNGYRWNPETKKMEKLIESKEDTDDKIVMSGIYFDREHYADEVELHLGNYEIEVRDGKIYAVFKNTSDRLIEPKFKVGDKIKHKNTVLTIISVRTNSYLVEDEPNNFGILVFSQQDKWELINEPKFKVGDRIKKKGLDNVYAIEITAVTPTIYTFRSGNFQYVEVIDKDYELIIDEPKFKVGDRIRYPGDDFPIKIIDIKNNQYHIECFCDKHNVYKNGTIPVSQQDNYMLIPKFDIATLKPFDKVLVRDGNDGVWINALFGFYDTVTTETEKYPFVASAVHWAQCIPYLGNEHLLGTTDDCDEYFNLIS